MNKGGFSWKRFGGITRVKQNISREIGIPLTRTGSCMELLYRRISTGAKMAQRPERA